MAFTEGLSVLDQLTLLDVAKAHGYVQTQPTIVELLNGKYLAHFDSDQLAQFGTLNAEGFQDVH